MATNNTLRAERSLCTVHVTFVAVAALLAIVATGCGLTKPAGASFASVKIKNSTPAKIQQAAVHVFREDGYAALEGGPGELIFQRDASKATNIGQNGFVGSYYGQQTVIRVRAQIVDLGTGTYRLQCQAYFVRDPGFMEDSHPMSNVRRAPFQVLLNKVARRVKET